jgi:hypothetical protein
MSSFLAAFPRIPANQFAKLPGKNRLLRSRYATHDETRFSLILSRIYALPCSSINNTHRSITWRFRITPIYKIFTNFDQHTHNLKAVGVFNTFSNYVCTHVFEQNCLEISEKLKNTQIFRRATYVWNPQIPGITSNKEKQDAKTTKTFVVARMSNIWASVLNLLDITNKSFL